MKEKIIEILKSYSEDAKTPEWQAVYDWNFEKVADKIIKLYPITEVNSFLRDLKSVENFTIQLLR